MLEFTPQVLDQEAAVSSAPGVTIVIGLRGTGRPLLTSGGVILGRLVLNPGPEVTNKVLEDTSG